MYLPIFFRVASLALMWSYDCCCACEVILKDTGKIGWYLTTTKYNHVRIICTVWGMYCSRERYPGSHYWSYYRDTLSICQALPLTWRSRSWVSVLAVDSGHVRAVSASERRRYICNVFSHWLRLFSRDLNQWKTDSGRIMSYSDLTKWQGNNLVIPAANAMTTWLLICSTICVRYYT